MKILLTGATGFVGSHLLAAMISADHDVTIVRRADSDLSRIEAFSGRYRELVTDKDGQLLDFPETDAVVHCAVSYGRDGGAADAVDCNVGFALQVLEHAAQRGCPYFLNTDTFFCRQLPGRLESGEPLYMPAYTLSKYQFRQWGRLFASQGRIHFLNLQLEHVWGPDDHPDKFVPWLERQLADNVPFIDLTPGTQERDFIRVEDVAAVYLRILGELPRYRGYCHIEVGTGRPVTLRRFVESLKEAAGADTELRFGAIPQKAEEIGCSFADPASPGLVRHS